MTRVFISHSSQDNESGIQLKNWLELASFQVFFDFDSDVGIQVGEDWERRLFKEIDTCQAMVILLSENWLASKWCFAEFIQARHLGKPIFPVIDAQAGDAANRQLAPQIQSLDLRRDRDAGLAQLVRQLRIVGLDAQRGFPWDHRRSPYPGLAAFQEEDAAIYFGRDRETSLLIEKLRHLRTVGSNRLLVILGASGSGKSSLLRAGVIPRLKQANQEWIPLSPFRPEGHPCIALSMVLAKAMNREESWRTVHQDIISADQAASLELYITGLVADIRVSAKANEAEILLSIDQAEELFSGIINKEMKLFYRFLKVCLDGSLPIIELMTLRSDFLNRLQVAEDQIGRFEPFSLGPLPTARIAQVIAGPASVAGIEVEDELVQQAVEDAVTEDALPLLAFALRQLHDRAAQGERLTLLSYQALGDPLTGLSPIENAVRQAAERALRNSSPSQETLRALREAFIPDMVRINEREEYVRQPAVWHELPEPAWPLLEALVNERVLFSRLQEENGLRLVEVAHEALLRKWPLLFGWLNEEKEFLNWYQRLEQDAKDWTRASSPQDREGTLLTGSKLKRARGWLEERPRLKQHLKSFIQASIDQDEAQARQRRRIRNLVKAFFAMTGILTGVFAVNSWVQSGKAEAALTDELLAHHLVLLNTDPLQSLVHGLAAAKQLLENDGRTVRPNERGRALQLSISLGKAATANWVAAEPVQTGQSAVLSLVIINQDELISGGGDGTLMRWRDGKKMGEPTKTGVEKVWSLGAGLNGELVIGDDDGNLQFWKDGHMKGAPIPTGHDVIYALLTLDNGELLSGGADGKLRRWRNGKQIEVIPTGDIIQSLLLLKSGDILSGGADGKIRRWRDGKQLGNPINSQHEDVWGLAELRDGEVISGGKDGVLRRWRNGIQVGDPIPTGQGGVMSLVLLKGDRVSGEEDLVSGGSDGTIRRWRKEQPSGILVPAKQSELRYLGEIKNGEVISAGRDGTLRRWRDGKPVDDPIRTNQEGIFSLAVLNDDVLTGGADGTIRVWRDGKQPIYAIKTGQGQVLGVAALSNGEVISLGEDGTMRRWQGQNPLGEPTPTGQNQAEILVTLGNKKLISGALDRTLRIWNYGQALGSLIRTEKPVQSLLVLDNDDLVTGYLDGTLGRWRPDGKAVGEVIFNGQAQVGGVLSLAKISRDELISGGANGTLQRWKIDPSRLSPLENPIETGEERVYSLLALSNGELVSGGRNSLSFYSLPAVVSAACHELKNFQFSVDDLPTKRAHKLCEKVNRQRR
jgi:WD40 repeat protein